MHEAHRRNSLYILIHALIASHKGVTCLYMCVCTYMYICTRILRADMCVMHTLLSLYTTHCMASRVWQAPSKGGNLHNAQSPGSLFYMVSLCLTILTQRCDSTLFMCVHMYLYIASGHLHNAQSPVSLYYMVSHVWEASHKNVTRLYLCVYICTFILRADMCILHILLSLYTTHYKVSHVWQAPSKGGHLHNLQSCVSLYYTMIHVWEASPKNVTRLCLCVY